MTEPSKRGRTLTFEKTFGSRPGTRPGDSHNSFNMAFAMLVCIAAGIVLLVHGTWTGALFAIPAVALFFFSRRTLRKEDER